MKLFVACLTFVVFLASANAQVYSLGGCPKVKLQEDLKLEEYLGNWYEHSAYPFLVEAGGSCIYVNYSNLQNDTLTLTNTQVNKIKALEKVSTPIKYLGGGQFDFQISGIKNIFVSRDYNVLATDYENYSVIYSCRDLGITHGTVIAIVTRERIPSEEVVKTAQAKIEEQGLPLEHLRVTKQTECNN